MLGEHLKIERKVEVAVEETDSLPAEEAKSTNREHELELELAEQRGELNALKKSVSPSNPSLTHEQTKQIAFQDINNLSEEDFQKKYKNSKHAVSMIVMDADNRITKAEAKQLRAESAAIAEISAKYGADFYKFKERILDDAIDLSEEARQDPERLKRWMERYFLALSKEEVKPEPRKNDDRRKVVSDFEKPALQVNDERNEASSDTDEIKDEIPVGSDTSNQRLAMQFGLRSEKERKEIEERWRGDPKGETLAYVPMDLTCKDPSATEKIIYGDPKKGFERVKIA